MKIAIFLNGLGLGGTEKAAARWARGLRERGHETHVLALHDGPRRTEFEAHGTEIAIVSPDATAIADRLRALQPQVLHVHAPGHPHEGDVLGLALARWRKIPVVQTNIFGQSLNPKEDAWTDFRLYISWTSCVQAARRNFRQLDANFFRQASVAVYPLDPQPSPTQSEIDAFRAQLGVAPLTLLFGRLSRPEPNKWTDLALHAFRRAAAQNSKIKLLLREPPPQVWQQIEQAADRDRFVLLPATGDSADLTLTTASLDAVLHTSVIGESFGYGIAEPMNLAKPVISNSTPWGDQAQIELVRHGECGFIASTPASMAGKILALAEDETLRASMGRAAQTHIRGLAAPEESLNRLESALGAAATQSANPLAEEDRARAQEAARALDAHQFGESWGEQLALRPYHYRVRFHQWRHAWAR